MTKEYKSISNFNRVLELKRVSYSWRVRVLSCTDNVVNNTNPSKVEYFNSKIGALLFIMKYKFFVK